MTAPSKPPLPQIWPLLLIVAGLAVALNYLFGSPFTAWMQAIAGVAPPLLGIPLLLLLTAVVPFVVLVYLGIRKKQ